MQPFLEKKPKKVRWTAGRPPWYTREGKDRSRPFLIGVTGGTSSGKTTVCHKIVEKLGVPWCVILSQDSFYKDLRGEKQELAFHGEYNFDHPDAFDNDLLFETLERLKNGEAVEVPVYDFVSHSRLPRTQHVYGADVILFEGILAFYDARVRDQFDLKVFVDADADIRLARRLKRDIAERGRDIDGILKQYLKFVKPSYDDFIAPTKRFANVIIPYTYHNEEAVDLIANQILAKMSSRGIDLRKQMASIDPESSEMPSNVIPIPLSSQMKAIHTEMRDRDVCRDRFVFLATRLSRLLIEEALGHLPFEKCDVVTPTDQLYHGLKYTAPICGVSIMRAGESMEIALREVLKDVCIGKLLIQTDHETGEPNLLYTKLSRDISTNYVLLMDPMLGTGATAMMALKVLMDYGVPQEHIFFLTLVGAPVGFHNISYAFPRVKVFTTAIDRKINENLHILPGMGNFGDRYFGTEPLNETMAADEVIRTSSMSDEIKIVSPGLATPERRGSKLHHTTDGVSYGT